MVSREGVGIVGSGMGCWKSEGPEGPLLRCAELDVAVIVRVAFDKGVSMGALLLSVTMSFQRLCAVAAGDPGQAQSPWLTIIARPVHEPHGVCHIYHYRTIVRAG
jgi:hypothetical protein